jgi:hypothetical protein
MVETSIALPFGFIVDSEGEHKQTKNQQKTKNKKTIRIRRKKRFPKERIEFEKKKRKEI